MRKNLCFDHSVLKLFFLEISTPENMTVLNGKQKVLLGGKQLNENAPVA